MGLIEIIYSLYLNSRLYLTPLILSFGFHDITASAGSLSVINVTGFKYPIWAKNLTEPDIPSNNNSSSGKTDSKMLIPDIVVPVIISLLGTTIRQSLFIRQLKRQQ
ncbi:unnamed protein product [Cunninghamella echinulata]